MIIEERFSDLAATYSNMGKCLEAARKFAGLVENEVEKILIVNSVACIEDKFGNGTWPFHAVVVGLSEGKWFAGAPGSGSFHLASDLGELLQLLAGEFGGMWPNEAEIEKAISEGEKVLVVYPEDWVC